MEKSHIFSLEKSQLQFTGKTGIFLEKPGKLLQRNKKFMCKHNYFLQPKVKCDLIAQKRSVLTWCEDVQSNYRILGSVALYILWDMFGYVNLQIATPLYPSSPLKTNRHKRYENVISDMK